MWRQCPEEGAAPQDGGPASGPLSEGATPPTTSEIFHRQYLHLRKLNTTNKTKQENRKRQQIVL